MVIGEMIRLHEDLEQVIDYALPEGTSMEDDGTGGDGGADGGAGGGTDDYEEPSAK